jgi:hypothetical protein
MDRRPDGHDPGEPDDPRNQQHEGNRKEEILHLASRCNRYSTPAVYTDAMQLHTARLCLDCQEVHEGQTCPVCGSESFAYISRWIPAPERRSKPRPAPSSPEAETYRRLLSPQGSEPMASRWLKRGAFGLAAVSAAAWVLKRNAATENAPAGEPGNRPDGGTPG